MPHRAPVARPNRYQHSDRDRLRRRRESAIGRLYDTAQWRRTKMSVLNRDPMCMIPFLCGGNAPSTDVDHKIPAEQYVAQHGGDARFFFDESNLRGACRADHSRKTLLEQRGAWREPEGEGGSSLHGRDADDRFPTPRV